MIDFESIVSDVKEIKKDVKEISSHIPEIKADLRNHMARTEASEKRLDRVENFMLGLLAALIMAVVYYTLHR